MRVPAANALEPSVVALVLPLNPLITTTHNILPFHPVRRPKIGVALSGGGARGLAQIGVIKALEEDRIPIDLIAGTSIGAVIGGLYALDYSPEAMSEIISTIEWDRLFTNSPKRRDLFLAQKQENERHILQFRMDGIKPYIPQALSAGQELSAILNELHLQSRYSYTRDFDKFKIPFRSVATDFMSGEKIILDKGDLSQAMMASMALPLLFTPITIDGRMLVDGGLVDNFPTDVIREMGANLVIGVNTLSPLRTSEEMTHPWEHADQVTNIMQKPINERLMQEADILITPQQQKRLLTDFSDPSAAVEAGYKAAKELTPEIKKRIREVSFPEETNFFFVPGSIEFDGLRELPPDSVREWISLQEGIRTEVGAVQAELLRLYETGYFTDVRATIIKNGNTYKITLIFEENPVINNIILRGNTVFSDSMIISHLSTGKGKIFNFRTGAADYNSLTQLYRDQNYTLAEIENTRFVDSTSTIYITISEGIIGAVEPEGNVRTKPHVILREFPLRAGEIFNSKKAQRGIANIYSTGLFERVFLSIIASNPYPRLAIKLVEKKSRLVKIGTRYGLERSLKGFIEAQNDNTFGIGVKSQIHLQYGSRDELVRYQIRSDRILRSYLTAKFDMYFNRTKSIIQERPKQFGEYEDRRYGGLFSIGRQIERLGTVTIEARVEDIRIASTPARYSEDYNLTTITFRSIVDTQDKYPFPRQGNYIHMYYEIANRLFGGEVSYNKLYSSFDWFIPVSRHHVIHPRASFGTADETLPFGERFRIGGDRSLFGYRENVLHGRTILDGSLEYRIRIKLGKFIDSYLSMRYDLAGIWNKVQNIQLGTMHHGYGTSFALDLPVLGPFEFGYGHSGQHNRFYLSLGHRF